MKNIWPQMRCRQIYFSPSLPILPSPSRENAKTIAFYHFLQNFPFPQFWLTKNQHQTKPNQPSKQKNANKTPCFSSLLNLSNLLLLFRLIPEWYPCSSCQLQDTAKFFKGSKDPLCFPSLTSFSLTPLSPGLFSPFNFIFRYHRSKLPSIIPQPFISKFN